MDQDILKICLEAGMTEDEFFHQLRICYASYVAAQLDENPQANVVLHTAVFADGNIVIESRREKSDTNITIN